MPAPSTAYLTDEERRDRRVCKLCGDRSDDVEVMLVAYLEPEVVGRFADSMPRCRDVQACRDRVEDKGEPWIIRSRTVSRVPVEDETPASGVGGQVALWH